MSLKLKFYDPRRDLTAVREIWNTFSLKCRPSYFLSWRWIENWLTNLPSHANVKLAYVTGNSAPMATFFVAIPHQNFMKYVPCPRISLNTTGIPKYDDSLWIEYNSIPCAGLCDLSVEGILALFPSNWYEMSFPAVDIRTFPGNKLIQAFEAQETGTRDNDLLYRIERDLPSYYVDLDLVREKGGDYLTLLSRNKRSQIKRSYRGFSAKGPIRLEAANSLDQALDIFNQLLRLHKRRHRGRNWSNFATEFSERFHVNLITKTFDKGEIQLIRVNCGSEIVGCLYNFVYDGKVFFYQSGLNYTIDQKLKPGLLTHSEAIIHNARLRHSSYDFLAGNEQYKSSLGTNYNRLIWFKVQKRRVKAQLGLKAARIASSAFDRIQSEIKRPS